MAERNQSSEIPRHEIEALARCLLPEIQKFFESEEGQREFEVWKTKQTEQRKGEKNDNS